MASKTTNYNLDMPGYNEIADIDVINGNMDKIDVQMKKNADSAQQSKDIVSDEYSATNTYAVGDYCIHENVLYKCKTAITTGEEFDSNKWGQTTCGTEFKKLNSNLADYLPIENEPIQFIRGAIYAGTTIDDSVENYCRTEYIEVGENTKITIKAYTETCLPVLYCYDSAKSYLSSKSYTVYSSDNDIIVTLADLPVNTVYVRFRWSLGSYANLSDEVVVNVCNYNLLSYTNDFHDKVLNDIDELKDKITSIDSSNSR